MRIEPNGKYLTIAGSFGITILAIAIPLSIDAIGRLSNRYQSNIITRLFNEEKENIRLKFTTFILVVLVLIISFFSPEENIGLIWKLIYIFTFILNTYIIFLLYKFFKKLTMYFIDTRYV